MSYWTGTASTNSYWYNDSNATGSSYRVRIYAGESPKVKNTPLYDHNDIEYYW